MASMSDSDEDDISSTIKRKQKSTQNKIHDSDSSSDEESAEKDVSLPSSALNQSITAVNEESCSSHLVIDESSKGPLSGTCSISKSDDDEVSVKDDITLESAKIINNNRDDDDHDNDSNKNKKGKLKKHCFDDESSDEEHVDNTRKTYESRNKSKSNPNRTDDDNDENNSEAQEKFDNALRNKDLFDAESDDEVRPKTVNDEEDNTEDENDQMEQSNDEEEELMVSKGLSTN